MNIHFETLKSPIGELLLVADDSALLEIRFEPEQGAHEIASNWARGGPIIQRASDQLRAYFAGELVDFDLPLAPAGTAFMKQVWRELERIPYGQTISYAELATRIGNPKASRATGMANGKNPIPIVIPCHRVIGSDGRLTGFAGGLPIKSRLLRHEAGRRATQTTPVSPGNP